LIQTIQAAINNKNLSACMYAVCKVLAVELQARLDETGRTHDVLEIGYSVDDVVPKKKKDYKKS